jgi:hypothetical protein
VDWLPGETRLALLVAAAEDTGELGVVLDAVARIGLGLNYFEPAERARLVRVADGVLTFRHPLIRSAVYGRAPAADRITAHRALADALPEHADRRAWHLAAAAAASTTTRRLQWRLRRCVQTGAAGTPRARQHTNGPRG